MKKISEQVSHFSYIGYNVSFKFETDIAKEVNIYIYIYIYITLYPR